MKLEGTTQSQPEPPVMDAVPEDQRDEDSCDGDFHVEGDGGTVDTGGQAQVPPPRPPEG